MIVRVFLFVLLFFCEVVLTTLIFSPETIEKVLAKEQVHVANLLGPKVELGLREEAAHQFRSLLVDTGIVPASYNMLVPTEKQRSRSIGMENLGGGTFTWVEKRLESFWTTVYQGFYRFAVLWAWVPCILPLAIPAIVDGLSARQIKKSNYGYASPVRYHAMTHAMIFLLMALPLYLALPFSVSPVIIPIWAVLVCLSLMIFTANIQKRL